MDEQPLWMDGEAHFVNICKTPIKGRRWTKDVYS